MKKYGRKIEYILYDLIRSFKCSVRLKIQLTITLCIGMLFPLIYFGETNHLMRQFATIPFAEEEQVLTIMLQGKSERPMEVIEKLRRNFPTVSEIAMVSYCYCIVEWQGQHYSGFVRYTTPSLMNFIQMADTSGTPVLSDTQKLCTAENSWHISAEAGQKIKVDGVEYTLSGKFNSLRSVGNLYLPYSDKVGIQNLMQHELYIRGMNPLEKELLKQWLSDMGFTITEFKTGKESSTELLTSCLKSSAGKMTVGAIGVIYATINIGLVVVGKLQNEKRNLAIRRAIGASYLEIYLSVLGENILCLIAAFICDICLVPFVLLYSPNALTVEMGIGVYLASFTFGVIALIGITWISTSKIKKTKLISLMERVT